MKNCRQFYIDGKWVSPSQVRDFMVINPATEEPIATISLGSVADVDRAVAGAKRAFESYSESTVDDRLKILHRIIEVYQQRRASRLRGLFWRLQTVGQWAGVGRGRIGRVP